MSGKSVRVLALLCLSMLCGSLSLALAEEALVKAPFTRGVNLTGWFEVDSPGKIQFTRFTKKDFENIKSLGADVIRLPVNLHKMTSGAPDYTLDPLFLEFLDEAVTWAEELGIYVIIDNHTFDPIVPTERHIDRALLKVWPQMAEHYKDRSKYVLYEVLNEPHGIDTALWGRIQGKVVDAIRMIDSRHIIVVGPANYNNYYALEGLPIYADKNLLYTFHFYDPMPFTHQGSPWTGPSLADLAGVPYPPEAGKIPAVPKSLKGSWLENGLMNYAKDGSPSHIEALVDIASRFSEKRKVPVFCGEFGAYMPGCRNEDRVAWYRDVRGYLEKRNIAWTSWDYVGSFGLFESQTACRFDSDLNVSIVEALGFTAPPQREIAFAPEGSDMDIYRDYVLSGIFAGGYTNKGNINFYSTDDPFSGKYAISWKGCDRYGSIEFSFSQPIDLSLLASGGYAIEMAVRTKAAGSRIEIRFKNSDSSADSLPWRMSVTLDDSTVPADGAWHKIRIPLSEMRETGAWKNAMFAPEGKFSWKDVAIFEIVAEHQPLTGKGYEFDDIGIVK